MRIHDLFTVARREHRKLFIPYITCGDPSLQMTEEIVKGLEENGADMIELGVPFSDPIADGEINQRSAMRALNNDINLTQCCALVKRLRQQNCQIPIILFTYFNPVFRFGIQSFSCLAKDSGVDAIIVVDLPVEEADELMTECIKQQIGIIFLVSPTSSIERIKKYNKATTEFIYYVSRTGVTGNPLDISISFEQHLNLVKTYTESPLAIGFGISTPEQASAIRHLAEGVVVGSALVKELDTKNPLEGKTKLLALANQFAQAIHQ